MAAWRYLPKINSGRERDASGTRYKVKVSARCVSFSNFHHRNSSSSSAGCDQKRGREREMQRGKTGAEYTVCRRQKHGTHSDTERLRKLRDTREVDIRRRERERERE
jgi:hypothetical protein